jgi:hypothetical protein
MLAFALTSGAAERDYRYQEQTIKAVWAEGTPEPPIVKSLPGLAVPEGGEASLFSRSLVSTGHLARLEGTLAKARRGELLMIGVIGGSITAGAAASQPEKRYGDRVAAWWRRAFPNPGFARPSANPRK